MLRITDDLETVDESWSSKPKVVLYFTAAWCGPCKQLIPQYARASVIDSNTDYFLVDIDKADPALLAQWNIQSVPSVFFLGNRDEVQWVHAITSRRAQDIVDEVNNLDC